MKQLWPNQPVTPSKKQRILTLYEETNANDTRLSKQKYKFILPGQLRRAGPPVRVLYLHDFREREFY
jgi:hypothetical protein